MTSTKISLDGVHKNIVDLNKDLVNFVVDFSILPKQEDADKTYNIAITTQEKIDSGADIKMTPVTGHFTKTIKNTTGKYQNYCLVLSSPEPLNDIHLKIETTKLEDTPKEEYVAPPPPAPAPTPLLVPNKPPVADDSGKKIKIIAGVLIVLVGGCALYYFWNKSKNKIQPSEGPASVVPTTATSGPAQPQFTFY